MGYIAPRHGWRLAAACAMVWSFLSAAPAAAEAYPSKPIRIIVPSSPSSGPDIIARLTGGVLTEAWGQQVVADNRAGAAGNIGGELAARAAADGYTLLAASSQQISGPLYNDRAAAMKAPSGSVSMRKIMRRRRNASLKPCISKRAASRCAARWTVSQRLPIPTLSGPVSRCSGRSRPVSTGSA